VANSGAAMTEVAAGTNIVVGMAQQPQH
jgi:hypothetical protein